MTEPTIGDLVRSDSDYPLLVEVIRRGVTLKATAYARQIGRRLDISASDVYAVAKRGATADEPS